VSQLVAFEGVTDRIDYIPEKASEQAASLLQMAIDNFKERRATIVPITGLGMREAIVVFQLRVLLKPWAARCCHCSTQYRVGYQGVAGLVSCTTLRDTGQDVHSVRVAKELIKRDVLVLSMGCGNGAMQVAGLCSPEAKELAGSGLRALCETLKIPPVLSYGTCTDTGRLADL